MIIEGIINFFITIFAGVLSIIPAMDFNVDGFTSSMASLRDMMASVGYFLPINDILLILTLYLAYQSIFFLIWGANWVVRRIADLIP